MALELINAVLATRSTQSRGGVVRQAIAAIENALLDIKGKALGVPVYQLFGGKIRDRIPVYWSHCGSYRMRNADLVGEPAVSTYDDFTKVGAEVKAKGFRCLKTNIAIEIDGKSTAYRPGFVVGRGFPERNWDDFIARSAAKTVEAFRKGCGPGRRHHARHQLPFPDRGLPAHRRGGGPDRAHLARARCARSEVDRPDPPRFAVPDRLGRDAARAPRLPALFRAYAFDTAIVDVVWNGFYESLKIAAMADVYEVNVRAAQFLRTSRERHQRPFLRRRAELPHHGDRHRQREMARRVLHPRRP